MRVHAIRGGFTSVALAIVSMAALTPRHAHAHPSYASDLPNRVYATSSLGVSQPCITCHNNVDGGGGCVVPGSLDPEQQAPCLNSFGLQFQGAGKIWSQALAELDADADGFTNGQELQDPAGAWTIFSLTSPGRADYVTRPGFSDSHPGLHDADHDGYCWFGRDMNADFVCTQPAERTMDRDCDDSSSAVNSGQAESCGDPRDNDCNGLAPRQEPICAPYIDGDDDGYCPMGHDANADGDCLDANEMTSDVDCDDSDNRVGPGAPENCVDGLDNNCNSLVDAVVGNADPACTGESDQDDDGYCPIGQDLNADGDCLDAGEPESPSDCDDHAPGVNPGANEVCGDLADNDCNLLADFDDPACASVADTDGDGYCTDGRDLDGNGSCTGAGELGTAGGFDCNDQAPNVYSAAAEVCTDAVDHDCDGHPNLTDPDCVGWLDQDGDGYCPVGGLDLNHDGNCDDLGELTGFADCDDGNPAASPGEAVEICTNGIDDNCDGSADASEGSADPQCRAYTDWDYDGACELGTDVDGDGDCADGGEQVPPYDAQPFDSTVAPGNFESCFDKRDNDQNGLTDLLDPACVDTVDSDGDGYCPVGRDVDGDGDCSGAGENHAVSDCNEQRTDIGPQAREIYVEGLVPGRCFDHRDGDCDGKVDLADPDCGYLFDRDGDGYCGRGVDDNADEDCLDAAEQRFGEDCDDESSSRSPGVFEVCDNGVDDDCDGAADLADSACRCQLDSQCAASTTPCAIARCLDGVCGHVPDPACADGGVAPDTGGGGGRCSVEPGAHVSPFGLALLGVAVVAIGVRRRLVRPSTRRGATRSARRRRGLAMLAGMVGFVVALGSAGEAAAWPGYVGTIPNSGTYQCLFCHDNQYGGYGCGSYGGTAPCLNSFGNDFRDVNAGYTYNAWLQARDSDGDGYTNAQEVNSSRLPGFDGDWAYIASTWYRGYAYTCWNSAISVGGQPASTFGNYNVQYRYITSGTPTAPAGCSSPVPHFELNECSLALDNCSAYASCSNYVQKPTYAASFGCTCNAGFSGDGVSCSDINECNTNHGGCSVTSRCMNTSGSYYCSACGTNAMPTGTEGSQTCVCNTGYSGNAYSSCSDINECSTNHGGCSATSRCMNTAGSYYCSACGANAMPSGPEGDQTCVCNSGYTGNAYSGCTDINECLTNHGGCAVNQACVNTAGSRNCVSCGANAMPTGTEGSQTCVCNAGYQGNAYSGCTDIDECNLQSPPCGPPNGTCTNSTGGYTCVCNVGYTLSDGQCVLSDACTAGTDNCDVNATCNVPNPATPAVFTCTCNPGWSGSGYGAGSCTDVDECSSADLNNCDALHATCSNAPGSYVCGCQAGYAGDGTTTCADVNECQIQPRVCPATRACQNADGSYACVPCASFASPVSDGVGEACVCNAGYEGDPYSAACTDVDECAIEPRVCPIDAACYDILGSYECNACSTNAHVEPSGNTEACVCDVGYAGDAYAPTGCGDVDECILGYDNCDVHAHCGNTIGGFTCTCQSGWSGDGVTCVDVDECGLGTDNCHDLGSCDNTQGGFVCACGQGWLGDGVTCDDENECLTGTHTCAALGGTCGNLTGGYECSCLPGFQGTGEVCNDVDECLVGNGGCSSTTEVCVNQIGASPTCACKPGFARIGGVGACVAGCGNGVVAVGEECDDGDTDAGDGCSADCLIEPGWACYEPDYAASDCKPTCGDGYIQADYEQCDDGAGNSDETADACRTNCKTAHCGDGVPDQGEACDLGAENSDTLAGACRTTCVRAFCGDGVVDPSNGEVCDPAGGAPLDASVCQVVECTQTPMDAGVTPEPPKRHDGGCGCVVAGDSEGAPAAAYVLAAFALVALGWRRGRRLRRFSGLASRSGGTRTLVGVAEHRAELGLGEGDA